MNDLTLVCISKVDAFASPFLLAMQDLAREVGCDFLLAADGEVATLRAQAQFHYCQHVQVESRGFLESVHDAVIGLVKTPYVLRLDDDEKASAAMVDWLLERAYRASDHWKFPRANLWTSQTFINSPSLWPDHQTRLSTKAKAMGRNAIHAGSPFGGGRCAPVAIEHFKFVVKTRDERLKIAQSYDKHMAGAGTGGMKVFSLPEDVFTEIPLEAWGDGTVNHR